MNITQRNSLIGAGAGALTGVAVAAKKAGQILKEAGIRKGQKLDSFVYRECMEAAKGKNPVSRITKEEFISMTKDDKKLFLGEIANDAKEFFQEIMSIIKSTKMKWIAGLAAAGFAIGAIGTIVVSKINQAKINKTDAAQ